MIEKIGPYILVGTSHVAKQSVKEIEQAIEQYKPEVVGIELDSQRLKSLYHKGKPSIRQTIKQVGAFGALFALVAGAVQKKVGKHLGVEPGLDMKAGYEKAREYKIPVALIDVPVTITLKKLSKVPFTKKMGMLFGLTFKSFKKEYRQTLKFDVKKGVPEDKQIEDMLDIVKKETPLLYDILIEQRNHHMVKRLNNLREHHDGYIMAVVGAGHVRGMKELLLNTHSSNQTQFNYTFQVEN